MPHLFCPFFSVLTVDVRSECEALWEDHEITGVQMKASKREAVISWEKLDWNARRNGPQSQLLLTTKVYVMLEIHVHRFLTVALYRVFLTLGLSLLNELYLEHGWSHGRTKR